METNGQTDRQTDGQADATDCFTFPNAVGEYTATVACKSPARFVAGYSVKLRPHQQQCRSNIVECYKVECCFDIAAGVDPALGLRYATLLTTPRSEVV